MMKRFALAALMCSAPAFAAERPAQPTTRTDAACAWHWLQGNGVGLWAEDCKLVTGRWHLRPEANGTAFALWVDEQRQGVVTQVFTLPLDATIHALLHDLRHAKLIADTGDCVFQPVAVRPVPRTIQQYEIKPIGEALKRFDATPKDEVPDPPCGDYGWSTHGTRYFQTDLRHPGKVVYIDEGQDGTFFDPHTITLH